MTGRKVVVIGGSRGVGRRIVEAASAAGARVLAVARQEQALRSLTQEIGGIQILSLDATDEGAPARVFDALDPDILVLSAGAYPPTAPLHELSWRQFAINWETDVKISFHFSKAALSRPLRPGTVVILMASGAALAGSPISGGYAGAKRAQMFIANYAQKESDRLGLDLRFTAVAPRMMPDTDLGRYAVAGYARYLGTTEADFIRSMDAPPNSANVAAAVIDLAASPDRAMGKTFLVSGKGIQAVA